MFRDHLALGYEIVKWDGDLGRPNGVLAARRRSSRNGRCGCCSEHYPSQRHRPWYDREAFLGLARIRGIECDARYAEAFAVNKLTLDLSGD